MISVSLLHLNLYAMSFEVNRHVIISEDSKCCGQLEHKVFTWKGVARGFGHVTVSPLRHRTHICMNKDCSKHGLNGHPHCSHHPLMRATPLEALVVNSFYDVGTSDSSVRDREEFKTWSDEDIYVACLESNDIDRVEAVFFSNHDNLKRIHEYASIYRKASHIVDPIRLTFMHYCEVTVNYYKEGDNDKIGNHGRTPDDQLYQLVKSSQLEYTRTCAGYYKKMLTGGPTADKHKTSVGEPLSESGQSGEEDGKRKRKQMGDEVGSN